MSVYFEDSVATVVHAITRRERIAFSILALGLGLLGIGALSLMTYSTASLLLGGAAISLGVLSGIAAASPDQRTVIDGETMLIRRVRKFPWQDREKENIIPFSCVYSIGVDRIKDREEGDTYFAVIRLNSGRSIKLWDIPAKAESDQNRARFVRVDPNLQKLASLTKFGREDRLD